MTLGIDLETFSSVNLKIEGLHKYVASPDFQILLFGYKFDDEETVVVDLFEEDIPDRVYDALLDPEILKTAWNAPFEIESIQKHYDIELDRSQWSCTMVLASMCGYALKLDTTCKAMNLPLQKDRNGTALIKLFSAPVKVRGRDEYIRIYPNDSPIKWGQYKAYNKTDVDVEYQIRKRIHWMIPKQMERDLWMLDGKINKRGIKVDIKLAQSALRLKDLYDSELLAEAIELTGLANPNSPKQLKEWLGERLGYSVSSLSKDWIAEMMQQGFLTDEVRRCLELRGEMSKSSLEKYETMINMAGIGDRIRGLFQLYGASKTGRWAGRGVQVQNLTHTKLAKLAHARDLLLQGDVNAITGEYGKLSHYLSMLIRTAFIPEKDDFTISDFSAIEAVITAWFANEKWRLDVFRSHGRIYEASAAMMFKIDINTISYVDELGNTIKGENYDFRSKGKIGELALGYGGGVGALIRMGALKMGLLEEELDPIKKLWRQTSPKIVQLWSDVEKCARLAIENPGSVFKLPHLKFFVRHDTLFIMLPSGRFICYVKPRLAEKAGWGTVIRYWSTDQKTNQWSIQETYGGKLVENIVQGTARDVLAAKMLQLDAAGFDIVGHVHDEVIAEDANPDEMTKIMQSPLDWAPGMPLRAATITSPFYLKD